MSPRSKRASSREVRFTAGVKTSYFDYRDRLIASAHVSLSLMRATLRHLAMKISTVMSA